MNRHNWYDTRYNGKSDIEILQAMSTDPRLAAAIVRGRKTFAEKSGVPGYGGPDEIQTIRDSISQEINAQPEG